MKGYPAKTPMEDGYKVVVWDPAQAYNPALEEDRVALDYLAATYARYRDLRSNPRAEDMPWDSAPNSDDEKGVCRLCRRGPKSYGSAHCRVLLPVASVDARRELFCNACLFPLLYRVKSHTYHKMGLAYPCTTCVECSHWYQLGCCSPVRKVVRARTPT